MPYSIETDRKWQKRWADSNIYRFDRDRADRKLYCLEMFSYPSGANLHVGHWYNFGLADSYARMKRMQGFEVFHPMGFDAFGLPAENYAIKTGIHPQDSTLKSIATMEAQLREMGATFDWDYELATCLPEYYKWNQWLFLKLYEKGLAYRKLAPVNWCPKCQTVLANEQVVDGACERCATEVTKKSLTQWFFKITDYAEELLDGLPSLDWPEKTKKIQQNWIGRSEGAEITFRIAGAGGAGNAGAGAAASGAAGAAGAGGASSATASGAAGAGGARDTAGAADSGAAGAGGARDTAGATDSGVAGAGASGVSSAAASFKVFTTRPDTLYGVTYVVLAPESPLVDEIAQPEFREGVERYREATKKQTEIDRLSAGKEKTGVPTGAFAINPANGERVPVWIADYVLASYGTGCVMAVPAHDERDFDFAGKYGLPIRRVIGAAPAPKGGVQADGALPFVDDGVLVNSAEFSGMASEPARRAIVGKLSGAGSGAAGKGTGSSVALGTGSGSAGKGTDPGAAVGAALGSGAAAGVALGAGAAVVPGAAVGVALGAGAAGAGAGVGSGSGLGAGSAEFKINYRLRDWLVSRQRYWGTPIPMVYCEKCGEQPVPLADLPVRLPYNVEFTPDGESPLKKSAEFMNAACPVCGGPATRDPDTLDTFVCSSWYYLRYLDNRNSEEPFDTGWVNRMAPVDVYVGGAEHAAMHLLYARFIAKALRDMGYVSFGEPFKRLVHQGTILGPDGNKMSKSLGNTVSPDEYVHRYGSDVFRMYLGFGFAYTEGGPWNDDGIKAIARFLARLERLCGLALASCARRGLSLAEIWQGTQGVQSTQGTQGAQSTQGTNGTQGAQNTQGTQDTQGANGTQGTQSTQGAQGPNGRGGAERGNAAQAGGENCRMAHSNAAQVGVDRTGKAQVAGDRVGVEHAGVDQAGADPAAKELNYARNYSIKAASADIERFQFNTAISRAMELLNALFKYDADVPDEGKDIPLYAMSLIDLIRLIAPFAPHFAEEAWEGLGLPYSIFGSGNWPSFDESALARDVVEMAVQINGAVRFKIEAPSGAQSSEIEALVRADGRLPQFVLAAAQKGGAGDSGQSNAGGGSPSHAAGKADGSGQSHAGGGAPAGTEASPATHQGGAAASEAAHQGDAAAGEATRQGDAAASPAAHQGDPASGLAASQDGAASGSTTRQENPASGPAARQGDGHGALERISRIIVIKGRLVNVVVG